MTTDIDAFIGLRTPEGTLRAFGASVAVVSESRIADALLIVLLLRVGRALGTEYTGSVGEIGSLVAYADSKTVVV